ncbi:MAG: hypothetical protein PHE29_12890, partial [Tissierellia bacterium]|nr:hypothetical protein [Tissierellia bacterium]
AANLFNIMMNNTDQLKLFTEQAKNANGEMDKMAAIKLDTLTGQIATLKGEWDKLILSFNDSKGGLLSVVIRGAISDLKDLISVMQFVNNPNQWFRDKKTEWDNKQIEKFNKEQAKLIEKTSLELLNSTGKEHTKLMNKLQSETDAARKNYNELLEVGMSSELALRSSQLDTYLGIWQKIDKLQQKPNKKSKELTDEQKKELLTQLKDKKEIDANKIQSQYETDVKLLNQNKELIDAKNKLESEDYETQLAKTKERITQLVNSSKGITKTLLTASFNEKLKLIEAQRRQDTDAYNFDIALAIKLKKEKDALAISNYNNDVEIAKKEIKDNETLTTKLTLLESTKNKEILKNQTEYTEKAKSLRESLHGKDYKFNTVIDQKQLETDLSGAYNTYDEYFNTLFPSDQVLIKQFEKWRSENLSDEQIKQLAKDWEQEISKSLGENVDITGMFDSYSLLHKKSDKIDYDKLFNLTFPSKQDIESAFKEWIKEGKTEG